MIKENNGFKIEANEEKGCRFSIKVEIKPEEAKKAHKEATKSINKEISIPGFRKGKAPEDAVVKQYGPHIEKEWKEILINNAFQAALELTQIYPYSKKTIEKARIEKCSLEEGATVILAYERYPAVPEVNFADITLPRIEKKKVTDNELNVVLLEIQKAHGTFEEIENRAVELNDYIDISIDKIDEEPPRSLVKERRFEVADQMLPWLKKMVIGLKIGDTAEGMTEADPLSPKEAQENYQPIKVRATIHGIKKIILPEINDALATKAGASSKEDLLSKIKANLEKDSEWQQKDEEIRALEDILLKKYPFEIPTSLLEAEISDRTRDRMQKMREEGSSQNWVEEQEGRIREEMGKEAQSAIRLHFLFTAISEKEHISLSKEELNQKLNEEMMHNPYYLSVQKQDKELFGKLVNRLSHRFLFDKIREQSVEKIKEAHSQKA